MTSLKVALFLVVVTVLSSVDCKPTHCERWNGDSQFRCAKDNYREDTVLVRNRANGNVSFKVGKWISYCGKGGTNYSDKLYTLNSGASVKVEFGEAGPGVCHELFVYDCKINNMSSNCLNAVIVSPDLIK
ncbi:hypothetical protein ILUMI_11996 [Ignelater luminosus]|uniref:Uncharacterized protein n=1 Tax=Ignelater luminosus TaxID=2038154 RepID=A0A8K0GDE3_IGNLU|nr:hypothetical protein ILUMI_11996 [Ignelater luminosus]